MLPVAAGGLRCAPRDLPFRGEVTPSSACPVPGCGSRLASSAFCMLVLPGAAAPCTLEEDASLLLSRSTKAVGRACACGGGLGRGCGARDFRAVARAVTLERGWALGGSRRSASL